MRHVALATACLSVLAACGGIQPRPPVVQESRRLEAEFGPAWEAAIRTLTERGYDLRKIDRAAGIIETGWLTVNPEYAASAFVTQQEDRYSDCGKPGMGQAFQGKQARLELLLHPVRRGETGLRIEAFFRTQRYSDAPLWADRPLGDAACSSRGRLEEEVKVQIQLRALSDHLERFRRGAP